MNDVSVPGTDASGTPYFKPLFSFSGSAPSFDTSAILPVVFLIIFIVWLIFTAAAAYHWFRYGHRSWLAVPSLAVHLFVSGIIILYMMSGL